MDHKAFFVRLGEESGRTFSDAQQQTIIAEIVRYRLYYEWNEAYSPNARDRLAAVGPAIESLKSLTDRSAELLALAYDESVAMGLFFDKLPTADSEGDELIKVLSDLGTRLNFLSKRISNRLERLEALHSEGGKPPNMHNYMLCWRLARIFEEGGNQATIDGAATSKYARYLRVIHDHLPEHIRPSESQFIYAAGRALGYKYKNNNSKSSRPGSIGKNRRMRRTPRKEQRSNESDLALSQAVHQAMKDAGLDKKRRPSSASKPSIQKRSNKVGPKRQGTPRSSRAARARTCTRVQTRRLAGLQKLPQAAERR